MKIDLNKPLHLTYCLNVHPGESLDDVVWSVRTFTLPIRDRVAPAVPFGLGLRLGNQASVALSGAGELESFKAFLAEHGLYVFTINGFPYGEFHGTQVKKNAYRPDWTAKERVVYTLRLADILAELLPDSVCGSISTAPLSFKGWVKTTNEKDVLIRNLIDVVLHLVGIRERSGREIVLGLEPEPDCFLENTEEVINFFKQDLFGTGEAYLSKLCGISCEDARGIIRRHLGVCFDTCHHSLQFEDLAAGVRAIAANGIRISKVQLSAAIRTTVDADIGERLDAFCNSVYLHQVKTRSSDGEVISRGDLPDALDNCAEMDAEGAEWRVHCHLPLYFEGSGGVATTADELSDEFFDAMLTAGVDQLEIETYTLDVLPPETREQGVVESIIREYEWTMNRLGPLLLSGKHDVQPDG